MRTEANSLGQKIRDLLQTPAVRRWGLYLLKAFALLAILLVLSHFAPAMPTPAIALFWFGMSAIASLNFAYCAVIRKTLKRQKYREGGRLHRFNEGRKLWIFLGFVVSAACMAGLLLELPKWDAAEWGFVVAAVPLYLVVLLVARWRLRKEYEPTFLPAGVIRWTGVITCILLCAAYAVFIALEPVSPFISAREVFDAVRLPFDESPSMLVSEAGMLVSLVDGVTMLWVSEAAVTYFLAYLIWRIVLVAATFFSITNLLGVCALQLPEIKRIFMPLERIGEDDAPHHMKASHLAWFAAFPLAFFLLFVGIDAVYSDAMRDSELTYAEQFVRDQENIIVYVVDHGPLSHNEAAQLVDEAKQRIADLTAKTAQQLSDLSE